MVRSGTVSFSDGDGAEDREHYCETLYKAVGAQVHVIIATFAYDASPTCSGLSVVRYSPVFLNFAM